MISSTKHGFYCGLLRRKSNASQPLHSSALATFDEHHWHFGPYHIYGALGHVSSMASFLHSLGCFTQPFIFNRSLTSVARWATLSIAHWVVSLGRLGLLPASFDIRCYWCRAQRLFFTKQSRSAWPRSPNLDNKVSIVIPMSPTI